MPGKQKRSSLDVGYLRTATSNTLASSIFTTQVQEEEQRLVHEKQPDPIAIELLHDNPYQPRVAMDEESLQQLAETIASQGFQGILIARPHPEKPGEYQITAGHRRREAAKKAGLKTLPVIVHAWTDQEMATLAATENIQREDLTPLEEGKLFLVMVEEMGLTQVEVASLVKKDRGYVRNRLRLAQAPADIQAFIEAKSDSMRAVIYLLDIEDPAERAPIIEKLLNRTLKTEDLPAYIANMKKPKKAPLPPFSPASDNNEKFASIQTASASASVQTLTDADPTQGEGTHYRPAQRRASETEDTSELSPVRVRLAKLKTTERYIIDYQKAVFSSDAPVTEGERAILRHIDAIIQGLL
jgi:ParB family chromosome partitioning protein